MTPTKTAAILGRLADDWRHEEAQLCKQFGDVVLPQSMRARRIKDTEAIYAAIEMIDRLEAAEKERDNANAAAAGVALHAGAMQARLEMVENERDDLRAEIEELHVLIATVKKQADAEFCLRVKKEEEYARLRAKIAEMEQQEPVRHEFQGRDGKWYPFIDERHYETTLADGSWPIRPLYALPGAKGE